MSGPSQHRATAYKLASILLQYPTVALFDGLDQLRAAAAGTAPRGTRDAYGRFLGWLGSTPPTEVAQHYVETFDLRRRCALYLTYHRFGDTRRRGMAMLTFTGAYRAAGFEPCSDELPDHLSVVLEFAALHPRGAELLRSHRGDLELVRRALTREATPYADVIEGVCAALPKLSRRDLVIVGRAGENGPPTEEVGLEPFAPPEYLTGSAAEPMMGGRGHHADEEVRR